MADYVKSTNFTAKDSLPSGNSGKIVKGAEIDTELTAVASAIASKANINSPSLTGTPTAPTAAAATNTTQLATTAFVRTEITNLGTIGTMAAQNANAVAITGGSIAGITDLAVADGGTGVSTIPANAVVLGNGTSAIQTVAPGSNGNVLTSNGTTWVSSTFTNTAFGPNQSWQNVTGSRATDTTYTNTSGRVIFVIAQVGNQTNGIYVYINGTLLVRHWYDVNGGAGQVGYSTAEFMVGPGDTYYVSNGPLRQWWEFRA